MSASCSSFEHVSIVHCVVNDKVCDILREQFWIKDVSFVAVDVVVSVPVDEDAWESRVAVQVEDEIETYVLIHAVLVYQLLQGVKGRMREFAQLLPIPIQVLSH